MGNNPHRLADRKVANMPAFDISHNKAEFSTLSFVCKPPSLFRGEASLVRGEWIVVLLQRLWEWQGSMRQSLSLATDRVKRILTLMKSQNVAIYNKK